MKTKVFFIFILFLFSSCKDKKEQTKPEYKDLVEAVYSSVVLEPKNVYKVNASVSGYIDNIYVSEDQIVQKGSVLFSLVSDPAKINEQNSRLNYELLKDSYSGQANVIEDMKLELKTLQLKKQNDSINWKKYESLYKSNTISKNELDQRELMYQSSLNSFNSLNYRVKRKEKELRNQIEQSRNNVQLSELRSNDFNIRSEITGKVYSINKEIGEFVTMQEPIAIVGHEKDFIVKMQIDEVDISKIRHGQTVIITLEAFKNKTFKSKITKIYPKLDERTQTFTVEAEFIQKPDKLYMGLNGEGNIIINERKNVLVIPREYLMVGNKVETEDGVKQVEIGLSNWNFVEILSGIDKNTVIYKPE